MEYCEQDAHRPYPRALFITQLPHSRQMVAVAEEVVDYYSFDDADGCRSLPYWSF